MEQDLPSSKRVALEPPQRLVILDLAGVLIDPDTLTLRPHVSTFLSMLQTRCKVLFWTSRPLFKKGSGTKQKRASIGRFEALRRVSTLATSENSQADGCTRTTISIGHWNKPLTLKMVEVAWAKYPNNVFNFDNTLVMDDTPIKWAANDVKLMLLGAHTWSKKLPGAMDDDALSESGSIYAAFKTILSAPHGKMREVYDKIQSEDPYGWGSIASDEQVVVHGGRAGVRASICKPES